MEKTEVMLLIIAGIAAVLIVFLFAANYFSKSKGRKGEKKVAAALRKIGKKHGWKVINNAYLPLYNSSCEVDHILVGDFGALVVETKNISGTLSGAGKNLTHKIGSKTHSLYNPKLQNKTHMDNLTYHLQKAGMKNVPVYGIVVFSADDIVLETKEGIYLRDLAKYISGLKPGKCNTQAIYNAIESVRIKNPLKKLGHDMKVSFKR